MLKSITKDWLVLPGGADINPTIYNKENYKSHVSQYSINQDITEMKSYNRALKEGRPIFGICRGMQLMSAMNGLTLIQNMSHGGSHNINAFNPESNDYDISLRVNNAHHQCVWTKNELETEDYKVYGYCSLSPYHDYQENENVECLIEPEIIYFPKTKCLGVQFHPEWMDYSDVQFKDTLNYLDELVNKLF